MAFSRKQFKKNGKLKLLERIRLKEKQGNAHGAKKEKRMLELYHGT